MYARSIESIVINEIKEDRLPEEIPGLPGGKQFVDALMRECPVVVALVHEGEQPLPFDGLGNEEFGISDVEIGQVTDRHGRSFHVGPLLAEPWTDEFGNSYSGINIKGNNFTQAEIIQNGSMPDGLALFGLQDHRSIQRTIRASNVLRKLGIGTEYILGLSEPLDMRWPLSAPDVDYSELVSQAEYKRRLAEKTWLELPEADRTLEARAEQAKKLEGLVLYCTLRAMDTNIRLGDIYIPPTHSDKPGAAAVDSVTQQNPVTRQLFDHANVYRLPEGTEPFTAPLKHTEYHTELDRFMTAVTIPALAENVAKLHDARMAHRFLHDLNITAYGGLVDLDSVFGEPLGLGDNPVTPEEYVNDLITAAEALRFSNLHVVSAFRDGGFKDYNQRQFQFFERYASHRSQTAAKLEDFESILEIGVAAGKVMDDPDQTILTWHLSASQSGQALQESLFKAIFDADIDAIGDEFLEWLDFHPDIIDSTLAAFTGNTSEMDNVLMEALIDGSFKTMDSVKYLASIMSSYTTDTLIDLRAALRESALSNSRDFVRERADSIFGTHIRTKPHVTVPVEELGTLSAAQELLADIASRKDWDKIIKSWLDEVVTSGNLPKGIDVFENFNPRSPSRLVAKTEHYVMTHSGQDLVYEASWYPLADAINDAVDEGITLTIDQFNKHITRTNVAGHEATFNVPVGHILEEVMSSRMLDCFITTLDAKTGHIRSIEVELIPDCEYVALVSRGPDGKKTMQVYMTGTDQATIGGDLAHDVSANHYIQQLLPLDDYDPDSQLPFVRIPDID